MLLLSINPQYIGIGAGVLTGFSMVPQLTKLIKKKKSDEISVPMLLCLMAGLILWIVYGCMRTDWPIIITNAFAVTVNFIILILNFKYKDNH